MTSSLTGTLNVDTNLANTITFNAGSSIVPNISGNWSPQAGGAAGTQLAQYGWRFVLDSNFGLLTLDTALNEIEFDLTSTPLVLSSGDFDASQLILPWLEVNSDFRLEGLQSGTSHEFDISAEPNQLSAGTLVVAGNLATLTIPIHVMVADNYADNPGEIFVSGQIVATAVIPEPSSSLLLLFGGCLLMGVKKFRNSRGRLE